MIIRASAATRNAMLQGIIDRLDLGAGPAVLKMYAGPQPLTADSPVNGSTLVGVLTFSDPSAPAPVDGVLTFDVIAEESSALAGGTVRWARAENSNGEVVFDGDVAGLDTTALIRMNTISIAAGGPIRMTSFTFNIPASIEG